MLAHLPLAEDGVGTVAAKRPNPTVGTAELSAGDPYPLGRKLLAGAVHTGEGETGGVRERWRAAWLRAEPRTARPEERRGRELVQRKRGWRPAQEVVGSGAAGGAVRALLRGEGSSLWVQNPWWAGSQKHSATPGLRPCRSAGFSLPGLSAAVGGRKAKAGELDPELQEVPCSVRSACCVGKGGVLTEKSTL